MLLLGKTYYDEKYVIKIKVGDDGLSLTYYFDGGLVKTETFADSSDFNNKVASFESCFILIDGVYYPFRRIYRVVPNGLTIRYCFVGNVDITETFDSTNSVNEKLAAFSATHVDMNGVLYLGRLVKIAYTNADTYTIGYRFNGNKVIEVTYADSTAYNNAIKIVESMGDGGDASDNVATPAFSQGSGQVAFGTSITITCATQGATIYYTTDGSTPSAASTEYTQPIVITEPVTIKAVAIKLELAASRIAEASYTVQSTPETTGYKGWLLGDYSPLEAITAEQLASLEGLELIDTLTAAYTGTYTATEATTDGARLVWAYPATMGDLDSITINSVDSTASFTKLTTVVGEVTLNVYAMTSAITPTASDEFAAVFATN